jgi:hypothetical protein
MKMKEKQNKLSDDWGKEIEKRSRQLDGGCYTGHLSPLHEYSDRQALPL